MKKNQIVYLLLAGAWISIGFAPLFYFEIQGFLATGELFTVRNLRDIYEMVTAVVFWPLSFLVYFSGY